MKGRVARRRRQEREVGRATILTGDLRRERGIRAIAGIGCFLSFNKLSCIRVSWPDLPSFQLYLLVIITGPGGHSVGIIELAAAKFNWNYDNVCDGNLNTWLNN